ncbi:MBOAT family protein [Mucilaginibacter sp. Bleaf8]|uniref:MBOAT family O-acyltransferase n=1 Tax=Mucilaginibacter sp. Bleaf8 TaxID=2834430 RepID=UPI001BCF1CD2|nr:MBOAT family O-acyltransferase [Mucilaginibacter sp. Bleaf8]MBS7564568.1 MBOAT family protein [Mucilaginibacter sp. Bleaf8]
MNFITIDYAFFLIISFTIYWALNKQLKAQNIFILVANYVFYGWWDYRFLLLIFVCATLDYFIGIKMHKADKKAKRIYLNLSLLLNIGVLFVFKYFNFFIASFHDTLASIGINDSLHTLNIILPVGLSFFTFQTLSYSLDIYKGKIEPTTNYLVFLSFTSFFPQLLAGPIERAAQLIPQLSNPRHFNYYQAVDGMRQITYGIFKKVVIADHLALRVNELFFNYEHATSGELFKGMIFFVVQLYTDFSGYSDIAIGTGKLFGFKLVTNFRTPFFAKTIPEAWTRWHISLTTWFRDYVYLPLVRKNKKSLLWRLYCTIVLFVLIGLWHGANFTFVVFGILHGLYYIPNIISKQSSSVKKAITYLKEHPFFSKISIVFTFLLVGLTTVLFRAPDIHVAFTYYRRLFSFQGLGVPDADTIKWAVILVLFFAFEWIQQNKPHQFEISKLMHPYRLAVEVGMIVLILYMGFFGQATFYYFKF